MTPELLHELQLFLDSKNVGLAVLCAVVYFQYKRAITRDEQWIAVQKQNNETMKMIAAQQAVLVEKIRTIQTFVKRKHPENH